jgi:uncharacterized membrane protein
MGQLSFAAALFIAAHLGVSSTPLRAALVGRIGERAYLGVYSLLAAVTLIYLIIVYNRLPHADFLWTPTPALRGVAMAIMPVAFVFLLGAFVTRNPTSVGQEATLKAIGRGAGLIRITRHPLQWAIVLWAIAHIIANGDAASLVFFGSLGVLSFVGTFLIDMKKARSAAADWPPFAAATSNVPFAAIVKGRNRLVPGELMVPILAGLVVCAVTVWGHAWISGVPLF